MNAGDVVTGFNSQGEDESAIIETQPSDPGKNSFTSGIAILTICVRIWKLSVLVAFDLIKGMK